MGYIVIQIFLGILLIGGGALFLILLVTKVLSPQKTYKLITLVKAGNYKQAIKVAKEIIAKDPNNVEAHYYLGESYYFEGRYELALIEYKSSDKIGVYTKNMKETDLREKLAELYMRFDNDDEAIKEYALLLKKYPNNNVYSFKIGELFEKKNDREQAIKYYVYSLKQKSNYPPAMTNLGVLLCDTKKFTEAEKILDKVVKMEPENYKAIFFLGIVKKSQSNVKAAMKLFETSQRDKTYKTRSLTERGMILMQSGKYEDAAIELERALKNMDKEEQAKNINLVLNIRYILASCYEQTRNLTDAIIHWEAIYSKKADFKNVADKLATYQELRMDDKMKDFMTATNEVFIDICKSIVSDKLQLNIMEMVKLSADGLEFHTLEGDNKWRNTKKRPKLVRIYRRSEPIEESVIRSVHETMREKEIMKALVITSSNFSKNALAYAQERPIELLDKNSLLNLIKDFNY